MTFSTALRLGREQTHALSTFVFHLNCSRVGRIRLELHSVQIVVVQQNATASNRKDEAEWHPATWAPAAEFRQTPIWPGTIPDAFKIDGPEELNKEGDCVGKVSTPTMTVYPAKGKNTGAAVVIFPGGGY